MTPSVRSCEVASVTLNCLPKAALFNRLRTHTGMAQTGPAQMALKTYAVFFDLLAALDCKQVVL